MMKMMIVVTMLLTMVVVTMMLMLVATEIAIIHQVLGQLSKVTDHVRVIQETTNTTNELLKYRIEEAFTDIQK